MGGFLEKAGGGGLVFMNSKHSNVFIYEHIYISPSTNQPLQSLLQSTSTVTHYFTSHQRWATPCEAETCRMKLGGAMTYLREVSHNAGLFIARQNSLD